MSELPHYYDRGFHHTAARRPTPGAQSNLSSFASYVEARGADSTPTSNDTSNGWYTPAPAQLEAPAYANHPQYLPTVPPPLDPPSAPSPPAGPQHSRQQHAQTNYFPSRSTLKCSVVFCTIIIVLILTGIGTLALLHHLAPQRPEPAPLGFPAALSQQLQDFSEDLQNVRVFRFPFRTGQSREQRHPESGGFGNFSTVMSFDVCCETLVKEFVCMGGTTMAHGGPPLEGALRHDQQSTALYLLLWVNSDDLVEVGCWLTGSYLDVG